MKILLRVAALAVALGSSAGCAVAPIDRAADDSARRVDERVGATPAWPPDAGEVDTAPQFEAPLTLSAALKLAFTRNPDIHRQYARLGIAHADLQEAARIANPTLSLAWLDPSNGGRDQTRRGISASFTDLLLLSSRRRLASAEFRRLELTVAADLVALAHEVEATWYAHLGALQIAAMRDAVAQAAESEAALAQRYYEAGNINRLQLDLQTAAGARARIDALRAQSEAAGSRADLARLLGLRVEATWQTVARLPAPPETPLFVDKLLPQALDQRLDLASVRDEVSILEDSLGVTRSWRLLGSVVGGYEREHEPDGSTLRGPTLNLELPLFNQGQGAVERAEARLLDARARRDALVLGVENEVSTGIERLALARDITDRFRDNLLPSAASAVARRQERVNFMLDGVFELMRAKRDEYDAWQGYLESVRDYWIARTALRVAVGGPLPGDQEPGALTIGVDEMEHMEHGEQP
ncbi:MAG: TolC family protein [Steroidobacteraceae bacterium]